MKQGIDYFPLCTEMDDKIELLEAEYGIVGFAIVIKLFQRIYGGDGYFCRMDRTILQLFSKKLNLDPQYVANVIHKSLDLGIFDYDKFKNYRILTPRGIQKRYFDATNRRVTCDIDDRFCLLPQKPPASTLFDRVWNVYPRKSGKDTAKAEWDKIKPDAQLTDEIIDAIHTFKQSKGWRDDCGRYIPSLTNFIADRKWESVTKHASSIKELHQSLEDSWAIINETINEVYN